MAVNLSIVRYDECRQSLDTLIYKGRCITAHSISAVFGAVLCLAIMVAIVTGITAMFYRSARLLR